ncbi:MAG: 50S ribosomal protein L29 [Candidatus Melainabacteria bacterium]|nr:50S ribosomal protein L29 [Candidatus Melainabacteria bacterium]
MLKLVEIKDLSRGEIVDQLKKSRLELVDLRMKFISRQLEDPSLIKKKRKEIARLLTIETQKQSDKDQKLESKPAKSLKNKKEKEIIEKKVEEKKVEKKTKKVKSVGKKGLKKEEENA